MHVVRWTARAAIFAALSSACSLVTSLDGLSDGAGSAKGASDAATGGSDASAPSDGSAGNAAADTNRPPPNDAPAYDAPAFDGSADAPTSPIDARSDAPATDAPALGYCASLSPSPTFCDDFDPSSALTKWDSTGSTRGAVSVSNAVARSAPNALQSSTNAIVAPQIVDVGAYKAFPALAGLARVETLAFDLYLDKLDTAHNALGVVGALLLRDTGNAIYELQFVVTQSGSTVVATFPEYWEPGDGGTTGYVNHVVTTPLALQKWTRVAIELTLNAPAGGTGNSARLLFDGVQVASTAINVTAHNGTPQVVLGVSYVSPPSDGWTVRYDDVTFDAK